eukprot:Amastigsp_a174450_1242.p2 type:complete len:176 gc:universal Amastigsp_a174450_1242:542-15(-)
MSKGTQGTMFRLSTPAVGLTIVDPKSGEELSMSPKKTARRSARPASPDSGSSESSSSKSEHEERVRVHATRVVDAVRAVSGPASPPAHRVIIAKIFSTAVNVPAHLQEQSKCASTISGAVADRARHLIRLDIPDLAGEQLIVSNSLQGWGSLDVWVGHLAESSSGHAAGAAFQNP